VFGSLAGGPMHAWSNVDLVIVERTDLPFLQRLREMRRVLKPRVATDLFVYTPDEFESLCRERQFFQSEILEKGRVVYDRRCRAVAGLCP
jgi:predicted nucleotidyltransferase